MTRIAPTKQMHLFPVESGAQKAETTSTFSGNLSLPIHRWFRYSAGFSALWVREVLIRERANGRRTVLDPFCGSGTVLLEAELCDLPGIGVEAHPFVSRLARAKLRWRENPKDFRAHALSLLESARVLGPDLACYPGLIRKCYSPETLARLDALRRAWAGTADGSDRSELAWLGLASILRECSPVGTAQWQYVLPNKTKTKVSDPYEAFAAKVWLMSSDMATRQRDPYGPHAVLVQEDARECAKVGSEWADLVITSPPYANNYDYADATRLEMCFFGEIAGWGDLQNAVRKYLVRSCTQHVAGLGEEASVLLEDEILAPIRKELGAVCCRLERERENHGGKKAYHLMIAAYFQDMAKAWRALRRVTRNGGLACFVIGDSAPYGIHVPVDRWLGELAVAAGFKSYRFEKTRDRNTKWKNRKHRVPLHEGRLWVAG